MKKIKITAVLLSAVMAVGMLSACGDATETASSKPQLKILMNNIKVDPNTYDVAQYLEEKTGYSVQYDLLPSDNADEKLNLIISSQEEYDGIQILGAYSDKFLNYAKQGALMDITELVDKYGTNIKKQLSEKSLEQGTVDGKLYGIVTAYATEKDENGQEKPSNLGSMLLVRTDIMKKAGVENMPQTLDEFTEMLRKMKTQGGIPLTTTATIDLPGLEGAFGIECEWNDRDGQLVNRVETDEYKEYLSYLKSLYDEGLLDVELPTNKINNMQEKFTSGKAYIMPMAYYEAGTIMDALDQNCGDYEVEYLYPLEGDNGQRGYSWGNNSFDRIMVIPKSAEHPEDVIKWIDAKLETETFKGLVLGTEGVDYEVKDGEYYPIYPAFSDHRSLANDFMTGIDETNYFDYWQARVRKDERVFEKYQETCADEVIAMAHRNPDADAPIMEASIYKTKLDSLENDFALGVITGAKSMDEYNTFIEKWKSEGGEEWTSQMNEWYSENK